VRKLNDALQLIYNEVRSKSAVMEAQKTEYEEMVAKEDSLWDRIDKAEARGDSLTADKEEAEDKIKQLSEYNDELSKVRPQSTLPFPFTVCDDFDLIIVFLFSLLRFSPHL